MTVQTNTTVATGIGNGVTTRFPVGFKFNRAEDLYAVLIDNETQAVEELTLNSDYTVSGAGREDGGVVTTNVPVPEGKTIHILRLVELLQLTDLRNQGKFFAEIHENTFDLIVMMAQQQQEQLDRAVKVPIGSPTTPEQLFEEFKQDIADADAAARASEAARDESRTIADKFGDVDQAISMTEALRDEASVAASAANQSAGFAASDANRAESARDAAFVNADVYPDEETGRTAVATGEQFQVVSSDGMEIIRYRKDGTSASTEVARYPSTGHVARTASLGVIEGLDFTRSSNLLDPGQAVENAVISVDGTVSESATSAYSGWIKVVPGASYDIQGLNSIARYDFNKGFLGRTGVAGASTFAAPGDTSWVRVNYSYTVTEPKGFYAGPVSSDPVYVRIPRLDLTGQVQPQDTTFLEPSINLFDDSTVEPGVIDPITGEVVPSAGGGYFTSDFIKVTPDTDYSQLLGPLEGVYSGFLLVGNYSANKVFIRRSGSVAGPFETYRVPPSVEYIRLTYRGSSTNRMLVEGATMPSEFVPYGALLKGVITPPASIPPVGTDLILDEAVTPVKTSFVKISRNLLNPEEVTDFKVVNVSGELVDSDNYRTSGFIAVEPGSLYSWYGSHETNNPFTFLSEFDEGRGFIVRRSAVSGSGLTLGAATRWVRLSFPQRLDMDRMFVQGNPPTSYEPFARILEGVTLGPAEIKEIKVGQDRPMLDVGGDLFFGTDDDFADVSGFNTLSTSDVHSLWDALMAGHPDYITKTVLGNDAFGNSVALYRLSPPRPVTPFSDMLRPKIFLISGIHGGEDVSGFGTYVLANRLCNAWASDAALEMLRFNVELLIIPVANPSGWNARTRKNGNGVDLNRNFPEGWVESDPADVTYGGPSPLSELEAQYISQVLQENPDIDMFCDFHNFGAGGGTGGSGNSFVWVSSVPGRYVPHLAQIMMQRLTRKWRADYDWIPDDPTWFAGYASVSTGGMAKIHALEAHGVELSATFEVCNVWGLQPGSPLYSPEQKRSTIEALVNWLVLNVKEVVRRG